MKMSLILVVFIINFISRLRFLKSKETHNFNSHVRFMELIFEFFITCLKVIALLAL